ncbi:MAG: hypothetical protein C5B51_18780 [Terriglobia bacterium]|nr:MAG: hypothetical protein C5B51_18780 [Terriglobia bacterium]
MRLYIPIVLGAMAAVFPARTAQKFYPDDPLWKEPKPRPVTKPLNRKINDYYDFFQETFFEPDKEQIKQHRPQPSQAVNTLGEVPDSAWFTNRIGSRPMTIDELVRGPGDEHAPVMDRPWTVVSGKNEGVTPGLVIRDAANRKYFLKFDPKSNPELASTADVLGSKFFYDLGYNTPENYIVYFSRGQLSVNQDSVYTNPAGRQRPMTRHDVDDVLEKVPRDREGRYRGMASLAVAGDLIGPFRYYGSRTDDPNDVVPHQNRRDLRGLYVFSAWLNHTDSKSINSIDTVIEEDGVKFIKHYLLDFGAILGSDSFEAKSPRAGNVYLFDAKPAYWQFVSLGFYVPGWMLAHYPDIPAVGHLEYESFDPVNWRNNYPNPAFDERTPGDTYWAAKKVMSFSDDAIRAIVATAQFSDPRAADWIVKCLIERRNRIGRAFFDRVLPLDSFAVRDGKLSFEDLAVKYSFRGPGNYSVQWFDFENSSGEKAPIAGAAGYELPHSAAQMHAAEIRGSDSQKSLTVYLRGDQVLGIDRKW